MDERFALDSCMVRLPLWLTVVKSISQIQAIGGTDKIASYRALFYYFISVPKFSYRLLGTSFHGSIPGRLQLKLLSCGSPQSKDCQFEQRSTREEVCLLLILRVQTWKVSNPNPVLVFLYLRTRIHQLKHQIEIFRCNI